jgi:hypothetical protein
MNEIADVVDREPELLELAKLPGTGRPYEHIGGDR